MNTSPDAFDDISNPSAVDRFVLNVIAHLQLAENRPAVRYDDLAAAKVLAAMPQQTWHDSISRLDQRHLIKIKHAFGVPFAHVTLTEDGIRSCDQDKHKE